MGGEACHRLVTALGDVLQHQCGHVLAGEVVSVFDVFADWGKFLGVVLHRGSVQPQLLLVGCPPLDVIPEEQAVLDQKEWARRRTKMFGVKQLVGVHHPCHFRCISHVQG